MTAPRISVIIVSYNRLPLLRRAIDSALAQTLPARDSEIIVIDNCSAFDVFAALADYGDRIRVIRNTGNHGCGQARNVVVKQAKGEFVAFLDDDDYWREDYLEKQLAGIGARRMSLCGQQFIPKTAFNVRRIGKVTQDMLAFNNPVCGPSGFFCRRSLFDKVQFDESLKYAEDWDFLIRVLQVGEIGYVAEPILYYTVDTSGGSMTSAGKHKSWDDIQYRFMAAEKHRIFLGEARYRRRLAFITLAHLATRPNKMEFIGHSVNKAGLAATAQVLAHLTARKATQLPQKLAGKLAGAARPHRATA